MASHKPKRRRLNPSQFDTDYGDSGAESSSSDRPLQSDFQKNINEPTGPNRSGDQKVNTIIGASVFRLQLDELLAKVYGRPSKEARMKSAEDAIRKLKRVIEHIPNREPTTVSLFSHNLGPDLGYSLYRF